jgi:hypothetical protein
MADCSKQTKKTVLTEFLKRYPEIEFDEELGIPLNFCVDLFGTCKYFESDDKAPCVECWNTPIE